jgi:hypothetical protein
MADYAGDDMETVIPPELNESEKRIVLITHDEFTFYCCEGKPIKWMENGKKMLSKTEETSIMVSGFICDCHGFFSDDSHKSYHFFEAGKNGEDGSQIRI